MAVKKLCCVYDKAAGYYQTPLLFRTDAEALRSFVAAVNEEGTEFNRHAQDYYLFCVAEWDEETGKVYPAEPQYVVAHALEWLDVELPGESTKLEVNRA